MDDTIALIRKSHSGDKAAREQLVKENVGLVHCVVKRFLERGAEREDLFQIGSIGLLKAIDKFDLTYNVSGSIILTGFPAISLPPGSSTTAMQPPFTSGRRRTLPKARLPRNRAYPIIHARRARAYEKRD